MSEILFSWEKLSPILFQTEKFGYEMNSWEKPKLKLEMKKIKKKKLFKYIYEKKFFPNYTLIICFQNLKKYTPKKKI